MTCCSDDEICRIDSVITIDSKGQIVLPKDLREKANLNPNEKIAVVACEKQGEVCCIMLLKADRFQNAVTQTVTPLIKAITKDGQQK